MRSGRGEESECPRRRGSGRCPGGQAEMGEDFGNHGGCSMEARIFARPPESEPAMMSTRPFTSPSQGVGLHAQAPEALDR